MKYTLLAPSPHLHVEATFQDGMLQQLSLLPPKAKGLTYSSSGEGPSEELRRWLVDYGHGVNRPLPFDLPLSSFTSFTQEVFKELIKIPFGETLSYKDVAINLSNPRGSRAVGSACGRNAFLLLIPCHRVLARGRQLGGFTGGIDIKKSLLIHEKSLFLN